jgi:hypothetical protein
MNGSPWTLDQLAERVGAALSVDYDGQASGRVREVPDQRAIRYYTTIGLVDRPAAMRGRTALYARRHLLQLVAIKRLQASGLSLARIQRELAGATDAQLERVARVPPLDEPAGATTEEPMPAAASPIPVLAAPRRAFWKRPGQAAVASPEAAVAPPPGFKNAAQEGMPAPAAEVAGVAGEGAGLAALQGVRLGEGVTLLVEGGRPLDVDEVAALRAAAGPLLETLRLGRERS